MRIDMLFSKIHRATVTDANLNYVGSITIDRELIDAARLRIGQKVEILNVNNGELFSTYVIEGERYSGAICLNGAAARKVHVGDIVIIVAYANFDESELDGYAPTVILVDESNKITSISRTI